MHMRKILSIVWEFNVDTNVGIDINDFRKMKIELEKNLSAMYGRDIKIIVVDQTQKNKIIIEYE